MQDKIAIVTGGGSGMGRAHSVLLAKEGARVVVTDRNEAGARETVALIEHNDGVAFFRRHDVSNELDWKSVVEDVTSRFGGVNILINNAGISLFKDISDTTLEEWDAVLNVNARGTFIGCREVIPVMKAAGGGTIINVSSTYALVGRSGFAAYSASKGAVRMMTKSLAAELAPFNIRVNSLHPGTINTSMTQQALTTPASMQAAIGPQLIRRPGIPSEVASAVLFLASDESSFITGSELVVDGGYVAV